VELGSEEGGDNWEKKQKKKGGQNPCQKLRRKEREARGKKRTRWGMEKQDPGNSIDVANFSKERGQAY